MSIEMFLSEGMTLEESISRCLTDIGRKIASIILIRGLDRGTVVYQGGDRGKFIVCRADDKCYLCIDI